MCIKSTAVPLCGVYQPTPPHPYVSHSHHKYTNILIKRIQYIVLKDACDGGYGDHQMALAAARTQPVRNQYVWRSGAHESPPPTPALYGPQGTYFYRLIY